MRLIWPASVIATAMLVGAAACAAFSDDNAAPVVPEAGTDPVDATPVPPVEPDADEPDAGDAEAEAGEITLRKLCPPPQGGITPPSTWVKRTLFSPPVGERMYPFGIATDSTHVTWVAQIGTSDASPDQAPYDGVGTDCAIMRTAKSGKGKTTVLARHQPVVTAVVLDGLKAYWAAYENNAVSTLRAQRRDVDCAVDCPTPELVVGFENGQRIVRMVRISSKLLFALSETGKVYRVSIGDIVGASVLEVGIYPGMAASSSHVYAAAGLNNLVKRVQTDGLGAEPAYFAVPDAGEAGVGVSPIATDCTTLWMVRGYPNGRRLYGHTLTSPNGYALTATIGQIDVFDLAADARYIYAGAANAGGLFIYDKDSGASEQPYMGGVWHLAVDDDGVYVGEHGRLAAAGTITMFVKK